MSSLKLPDISREKVVLFHLVFPDSKEVVLQIPPKVNGQVSNTFNFDLNEPADSGWFQGLLNYRDLFDKLMLNGHAAYYPRSGTAVPIEDKDAQEPSLIQQTIESAEVRKNAGLGKWEGFPVGVRRSRFGPFGKR